MSNNNSDNPYPQLGEPANISNTAFMNQMGVPQSAQNVGAGVANAVPDLPKVEKPSNEEGAQAIANAKAALVTGIQYIGYGANKIKEKAIEHDVAGKTKEAMLNIKKQSDEKGYTEEVKTAAGTIGRNLKGAAIDGAAYTK